MPTQREEIESLKKEARPGGTRFAAITLVVLLVLVGIYWVTTHGKEVASSPVIATDHPSQG